MKTRNWFNPNWSLIPGDDVPLRLPTPKSKKHIRFFLWDKERMFMRNHYCGGWWNKRQEFVGKMWLGIKKSDVSSDLMNFAKPEEETWHVKDKHGDCGYLLRDEKKVYCPDIDIGPCWNATGLYWLNCQDAEGWLESTSQSHWYVFGTHTVACEFDEPQDCEQVLLDTCTWSDRYNACVLAGQYKTLKEGHPRLGRKCRENETIPLNIKCPVEFWDQCRQDCQWGPWQISTHCWVNGSWRCEYNGEEGVRYKRRWVNKPPKRGGTCLGITRDTQHCICKGSNLKPISVIVVLVIAFLHVG